MGAIGWVVGRDPGNRGAKPLELDRLERRPAVGFLGGLEHVTASDQPHVRGTEAPTAVSATRLDGPGRVMRSTVPRGGFTVALPPVPQGEAHCMSGGGVQE